MGSGMQRIQLTGLKIPVSAVRFRPRPPFSSCFSQVSPSGRRKNRAWEKTLPLSAALACLLATACTQAETVTMGDSIARGTCCSTVGPADYLAPSRNLAVDGNQISRVTALLPKVKASRIFLHVGVNDVGRDNPNTERDWVELLAAIKARTQTRFVVVEIGPMNPRVATPARNALRDRLNTRLRALDAPHVTVLPFVATSLPDGLHPDNDGYRQMMPAVVRAMASSRGTR